MAYDGIWLICTVDISKIIYINMLEYAYIYIYYVFNWILIVFICGSNTLKRGKYPSAICTKATCAAQRNAPRTEHLTWFSSPSGAAANLPGKWGVDVANACCYCHCCLHNFACRSPCFHCRYLWQGKCVQQKCANTIVFFLPLGIALVHPPSEPPPVLRHCLRW